MLMRPLRSGWYALHVALVMGVAWKWGIPVTKYSTWPLLELHLICINLVTFLAYCADKHAARRGGWRTPERTLHALALVGGTPAALLTRLWLRHKTVKGAFIRNFWLTVAWQAALIAGGLYVLRHWG